MHCGPVTEHPYLPLFPTKHLMSRTKRAWCEDPSWGLLSPEIQTLLVQRPWDGLLDTHTHMHSKSFVSTRRALH